MRQKTFYVTQPISDDLPWVVVCEGIAPVEFQGEAAACQWAIERAKTLWANTNIPSRVLVQGDDGQWRSISSIGLHPPEVSALSSFDGRRQFRAAQG